MPVDYRAYPPDFKQIAHRIKEAAGWRCQECGQTCRKAGESLDAFKARVRLEAEDDEEGLYLHALPQILREIDAKPQRYTLTVAHFPDPTPSNVSDENLRALCSACHLRLDAQMHARNANATRQKRRIERGQIALEATP